MAETPPLTVLLVDDEEYTVESCRRILEAEGFRVLPAATGSEGLALLRRERPEIVLVDLRLPDVDGLEVLREAKALDPETVVIMITGFATVESSLEAIRAGAYDYIPKPFTAIQLQVLVGRAARHVELARENRRLREELARDYSLDNLVGRSPALQAVGALVRKVACTDASVLISGESGTGKELVARALHGLSHRAHRPFVAVNCAAFPGPLLESELFGHEKGAFTGADARKKGLLEHASGGTFFLDEVCETSPEMQAKLLRALQERRIRRVGGSEEIPVDVRVVAATNRDPEEAVRRGDLRRDLYFRLNVVPIRVPPLRERTEDIPLLTAHFLRLFGERYLGPGEPPPRLTPAALDALVAYPWPGNVRELQNVVERIVSLSGPGAEVGLEDLPGEVRGLPVSPRFRDAPEPFLPFRAAKEEALRAFEEGYLRRLMARVEGNVSRAARVAGVDRKTVQRLLRKHGLGPPREAGA